MMKPMDNYSDEYLIKLYRGGDDKALTILIGRYFRHTYNFIAKYIGNSKEAEDLTQEVFFKTWRNLNKFDATKAFKSWFWQIVRNTCIDYSRRKKIIVFSSLEPEGEGGSLTDKIVDPAESIVEKINKEDLAKELAGYLAGLNEKSRTVLLLHYNQWMTFQEIADLLGESIDTVKSRHRRALIALKGDLIKNKMHQN